MKKFFTTLLLLVLMTPFALRADEVVIGTGTDYDYTVPFNTGYTYSWTETIYPGSELGGACTINSLAFNCNANDTIPTFTMTEVDIYMGVTHREAMSSVIDWTPAADLTLVYSGENVVIGDMAWETFVLDSPFYYSGEGNIVVVVAKKTNFDFTFNIKWYYTSVDNTVLYRRNDSTESIADEHPGSAQGTQMSYRANIKFDVTYGELDSPITITPNSIDLGHRPIGAWMRPVSVDVTTDETATISSMSVSNPFFVVSPVEMPYELTTENPLEIKVSHLSTNYDGQMNGELFFNHSFGSDVVELSAVAYTPGLSDVWEMPRVIESYPFTETPVFDNLYDNYLLPGEEQDGPDAVYRLTFQEETSLSAMVNGANGKVALYATHFNGKGGPDYDNYYGAPANPDDDDPSQNVLGDSFFDDFDDTVLDGWRTIDADGDYYTWKSSYNVGAWGYNDTECICSESYSDASGAALTPDNYIVTDGLYTITENSTLSFYAMPQDTYYYQEHYGVVVSSDGVNFTTIWEHTVDINEAAEWTYKTVDLSNYAGRNMYIGLRHFDCDGEYRILIDNLQLSAGTRSEASNKIENMTLPAGTYYLVASATEQFTVTVNTSTEGGYNTVAEVVAEKINDQSVKSYWSWNFISAKDDDRSFSNYKVYRKNFFNDSEAVLLTGNVTDTVYVDNTWGNAENGIYKYGVSVVYNDAKYETPIVWSNEIDKGMSVSLTVNVETENGTSAEGAHVSFVNADDATIKYETTLGASGSYTWNDFRLGTYNYTISLDGFNTTSATIEITEATTIDCVLEETFVLGDLYVSPTGWAMWNEDEAETYVIKLDGTTVASVWSSGYQFDVTNLVEGQEYTTTVVGSTTMEYTWTYNPCENFVEATDYQTVVNGTNVELSWTLPIGAAPTEFMFDFEDGDLNGFTTINANNDNVTWMNSHQYSSMDCGYESHYSAISCSYYQTYDITPDDYLVTAEKYAITENSKLTFDVCAENYMWAAEHYGVAISTTGCTEPSDFTIIFEETLTAKKGAKVDRDAREQGTWFHKSIDLSAYAGQNVYVAIRHFDCFGQFFINIDNLALTSSSKEEPNTTDLIVLGAMVYRDGELLTDEPLTEGSFVDVNPGYGDFEYSIRVVYGGDDESYYAMSCPQTETVTVVRVCEAPHNLYAEEGVNENGEFGASLVWPYTMQGSEWLYYDNGTNVTGIGLGTPSPFYFGIMFPYESLELYGGTYITKVSIYDYQAHQGNLMIYYGGDNAPETLVHTQPYSLTGSATFVELDLTAPLPVDSSMNLWIVFNSLDGSYPAPGCNTTGDPNGRWISFDGVEWQDVTTAGAGLDYTWMIRAFVTSEFKSEVELDRENVFEHYNVYRSTTNSNYEVIAETTEGKYFDVVEPGTYYYQVTAVYTIDGEECESSPANAYETDDNYVVVEVTSIDENGVNGTMIYPNPAKDFVKLSVLSGQLSVVRIYNCLGMLVEEIEVNATEVEINTSDYNSGIYFINIETEDGNITKKIIKT